jgi:hypothetical protein
LTVKVIPTEHQEQVALFEWAAFQECVWPELRLLHAIPNGGKRDKVTAARLKAEGVKPGVPDVCLPVPRGDKHGLYIEMKRRKGGSVSADQLKWIESLMRQGYECHVCRGCEEARLTILAYLGKD